MRGDTVGQVYQFCYFDFGFSLDVRVTRAWGEEPESDQIS
jgi:hypothetical protein